MKYDRFEEINR